MSVGCCLQLLRAVVLLRALSDVASSPLRVLAISQMSLTDYCGKAHLG